MPVAARAANRSKTAVAPAEAAIPLSSAHWAILSVIRSGPFYDSHARTFVDYRFVGPERTMAETLVKRGVLKRRRGRGPAYAITPKGLASYLATH